MGRVERDEQDEADEALLMQDVARSAPSQHRSAKGECAVGIVRKLQQLGINPALQFSACGPTTGGVGVELSVRTLDTCRLSRHWELARVRALLLERSAVTVTLIDAGQHCARQLERLLRHLRRASSAPCIDRRRLGLTLRSQSLPLPAYLVMSRVWLGDGPRYVMLDETQSAGATDSERAVFSTLYQQRTRQRSLSPVYGGGLRSRCPLLPDENGTALTAPFALLAPASSAWLPLSFNLCRFCDRHGRLRQAELLAALRAALGLADQLLDHLYWSDASQRLDARENRRIAFLPEGIGDLVLLQRADPAAMDCLRTLDRLFAALHECLWDESRRLAAQRGVLPALAARNGLHNLPDASARHHWRQRWQQAVAQVAVRHRNLLVMSPYALLPQNGASASAFADLLPLLSWADAVSFAGRPRFAGWRIEEYRAFHRRAAAVMRRRNATSLVATGV